MVKCPSKLDIRLLETGSLECRIYFQSLSVRCDSVGLAYTWRTPFARMNCAYSKVYRSWNYGLGMFLEDDNAIFHAVRSTMDLHNDIGINGLDWPAQSPDLNPI
ncbi:hypothetical protein TNCV_2255831 [Trichonephila clavipes]|nr:hypothetical protein TNCV_2255831 [Trichonephila clavipes]